MIEAVSGCTIFDGQTEHLGKSLLFEDGLVAGIVDSRDLPVGVTLVDGQAGWLVPGFIDLQVNGGGGLLFNDAPTVETIRAIGQAHRVFGTTAFFPTLITDSFDKMKEAASAVRQAFADGVPGVAGIHFEGPFLGAARPGVHDASKFCVLDARAIDLMTSLGEIPVLVTLAPEACDTASVAELVRRGVTVSIGHTGASYDDCLTLIDAGATGFTHLFNAMTPLESRAPGAVGAAITDDRAWFSIIADGHHCHPASLKTAVRAKPRGGAVLVTDSMPTVGTGDSEFCLNGENVSVIEGRCTTASGALAGSALDMMSAVNNAHRFAGIGWYEAIRMATSYPALATRLDPGRGTIRKGTVADMVLINAERRVVSTWINGSREDHVNHGVN